METVLTIAGWVSIGVLLWFVYGWVRGMVRSMLRPRSRTDSVQKDMY